MISVLFGSSDQQTERSYNGATRMMFLQTYNHSNENHRYDAAGGKHEIVLNCLCPTRDVNDFRFRLQTMSNTVKKALVLYGRPNARQE